MLKNKQNLIYIAVFSAGILSTLAACWLVNKNKIVVDLSPKIYKNDKMIAKVNGQPVFLKEAQAQLSKFNQKIVFENLKEDVKKVIAREVVAQKLLMKDALKEGVHRKNDFDNIRNYAVLQVQQKFLNDIGQKKVTEKQLKAQYDKLVASVEGKHEYKVRHILTKNKADAVKAASGFSSRSFEETAKKYSIDENTAKNGGDLGYILEGETLPEFEEQIQKFKTNGKGTSKPFKTSLGWHIIKVEGKRKAAPEKYEDIKEGLKVAVSNESRQNYINNLVKDAKIEILN